MNKQEKLAELHSIRTTLDKVAKNYCSTPEERKTVKEISMRLFQTQILPLAEELTVQLVKNTQKAVSETPSSEAHLIDLGLPSGTKWADRNVGADAPEKTGYYFRWGEIIPFTEVHGDYFYQDLGENIAGTVYDAANLYMGKEYKMPTDEQMKELIQYCSWKWTQLNGVNGMRVTGPNGNSIFLPAAGWRDKTGALGGEGERGYYWSASPLDEIYGTDMYFDSDYWSYCDYYRAYGQCVRPVSE